MITSLSQLYSIFQQHPRLTTDSRQVKAGDLFVALKGYAFDGNKFAAQALKDGAAFALVDEPSVYQSDDERYLLVDDCLLTLQDLARRHRRQFDIPIIAVAGSNGKTTTKELIGAVLGGQYPSVATVGNLNNHIGVPLTLLSMGPQTEVAIIEMGANHPTELAYLCRIAEPTHGLITNIGKEHLEGFGSLEGVMKSESELYRYLAAHNGMAFVNLSEPYLEYLAAPLTKKLFYVQSESPDLNHHPYEVQLLHQSPFVSVAFLSESGERIEVNTRIVGAYNLGNIMTAIALGKYFKVPSSVIKQALEAYQPSNNRSQLLEKDGNTFLLDAYNANPSSMEKALQSFAAMDVSPKIAMLGDMFELGEHSAAEHAQIAQLAGSLGLHQLVLVGQAFSEPAATLGILHFQDAEKTREWFQNQHFKGAWVLVKGSRGMRMEKITA